MRGKMANDQQKCPICGTRLKMINGRMTCKECGYYIRNDSANAFDSGIQTSETQTYHTQPQSTNSSGSSSTGTTQKSTTIQQPKPAPTVSSSTVVGGSGQGSGIAKRIAIVIAVVLGMNILVGAIVAVNRLSSNNNSNPKQADRTENVNESGSKPGDRGDRYTYMPQTYFFQALSSVIFNKDVTDITEEEFSSITALEIDFDNYEIYYELNQENGSYLTFNDSFDVYLYDLKYFPGLEVISLIGRGLKSGDLDGLENLNTVYAENTISELSNIVPYPENITAISVYDTIMEHSLTGIQKFPNLEYLTVQYYGLSDISALKEMPSLLGVALIDCDRLTDFSPLMEMTGLERLSIDSAQLKTIDFINVMPNLTYLDIEGSYIPDIEAIANCPNLTNLYLIDNSSVNDYSVVENLVNLTDLTIHKNTHAPIPSFEKLTQLERVSIKNLWEEELPLVTAASNINQLYLENSYDDYNLELLADLPLTWLALVDCSISGDHPLEFLTRMPDLAYLDLTETYVFGNIEDIFGIPALEYLYLKEATGVIDFDRLPSNENLLVLDVSGLDIKTDAWGDEYYDMKDHYDMFEKYPNVEYLYAASLGLDSIDFVTNLPNLQYLSIIDNNVTSIKPLESLNYFHTVLCGENSILESVSEESGIYVDTETDYYPYRK